MDNLIFPECFLDTMLIETLVFSTKGYNHKKGCNMVCKVMNEDYSDCFALGILDDDGANRRPPYSKEFIVINEQHQVMLFKHPQKHHYLIFHPPIENWLLAQAKECNLALSDYSLPTDLKNLLKITKVASSKKDYRFRRLFSDLANQNAEGISVLKKWTSYLKDYNYKTDINILKNL